MHPGWYYVLVVIVLLWVFVPYSGKWFFQKRYNLKDMKTFQKLLYKKEFDEIPKIRYEMIMHPKIDSKYYDAEEFKQYLLKENLNEILKDPFLELKNKTLSENIYSLTGDVVEPFQPAYTVWKILLQFIAHENYFEDFNDFWVQSWYKLIELVDSEIPDPILSEIFETLQQYVVGLNEVAMSKYNQMVSHNGPLSTLADSVEWQPKRTQDAWTFFTSEGSVTASDVLNTLRDNKEFIITNAALREKFLVFIVKYFETLQAEDIEDIDTQILLEVRNIYNEIQHEIKDHYLASEIRTMIQQDNAVDVVKQMLDKYFSKNMHFGKTVSFPDINLIQRRAELEAIDTTRMERIPESMFDIVKRAVAGKSDIHYLPQEIKNSEYKKDFPNPLGIPRTIAQYVVLRMIDDDDIKLNEEELTEVNHIFEQWWEKSHEFFLASILDDYFKQDFTLDNYFQYMLGRVNDKSWLKELPEIKEKLKKSKKNFKLAQQHLYTTESKQWFNIISKWIKNRHADK